MTTSPLWPSVRARFVAFSAPLEGVRNHLYLDIKGLVTTGIGYLVDSVERVTGLPWLHADGLLASQEEIRAEWVRIKAAQHLAQAGADAAEKLCRLHLSPEAIERLTQQRLDAMARELGRHLPGLGGWPASAQLAAMSMCWAVGVAGLTKGFPKCCRAMALEAFDEASDECLIQTTGNPGIAPRNARNVKLLLAAAHVVETNGDRSVLLMEPPAEMTEAERARALGLVDLTARASIEEGLAEDRRQRGGEG